MSYNNQIILMKAGWIALHSMIVSEICPNSTTCFPTIDLAHSVKQV